MKDKMKMSLLVPTRGRPSNMERMTLSAFNTAEYKDEVEIIFYLDNDDPDSMDMAYKLENHYGERIQTIIGNRIILSQMWNECWNIAKSDIGMHCGDDVVFKTESWDALVFEEFRKEKDKILFVYGRDGIVDSEDLGTHGFLHRNWVETVGYFVPPYFSWCYNDTWLTEVSRKINRLRFLPNLYIQHIHPCNGGTPMDATYSEASARGARDKCLEVYNSKEKEAEREMNAQNLQEFILEQRETA